jgi:DNA (cytosine-5)-methyltransferase 1
MKAPSVVSLFCGCGGLDLGFKEQGFDLVYACDNDPVAVGCYSRNVDHRVFLRSVTDEGFRRDLAEIGRCDVVLGGFPCQGFSKAGPKLRDDSRNLLYTAMQEAVSRLRPKLFVAENVDGLSQNFGGTYLRQIVADFEQLGYRVEHRILDALAFGVPQHRRRIFFVGTCGENGRAFCWPAATHAAKVRNGEFKFAETFPLWERGPMGRAGLQRPRTIRDAIGDLVELNPQVSDHQVTGAWPKKYEAVFRAVGPGQKLCNVRHSPTSVYTWDVPDVFGAVTEEERVVLETIAKHRRHKRYGDVPNGNPLPVAEIERLSGLPEIERKLASLTAKGYLKALNGRYDLKGAMFCSGIFKRPRWNEPAPTVLTNFHNPRYFLHPLRDRPFSLRECARLQSFPDTFVFSASSSAVDLVAGYRLVGNAVAPLVSRHLALAVAKFFAGVTPQ